MGSQFFEISDVNVYCCEKAELDKYNHGSCAVKIKDGDCVCAYCEKPSRNVVVPSNLTPSNKKAHV